jgi:predicted Zn-dependent peptidase
MEREGGWNNAWTSNDRTDYYDVGPSHTLPLLLWMEADRLHVLGSQIDRSKLDTQRAVVRNERRQQTENRPYEKARLRLPELLFPPGHPYHHPVIGSHADLAAASVADVQAFFAQWYVPANMSLVVAGDFDAKEVRVLIERYFGAIPKGPAPPARAKPATPAKLEQVVRETMEDNVTLPKVVMAWPSPAAFASGDAELDILSEVLTEGKTSRLYKSLVYDKKLAQTVSAYQSSMKLRSHFNVEAVARPGVALEAVEKAIDEELERVRSEEITSAELQRSKNQYEAGFVGRLQSLATRASMLNGYYSQHRNPGYAAADLQRYLDVAPGDVLKVAKHVLQPNGRVILHIVPRKSDVAPAAEKQP